MDRYAINQVSKVLMVDGSYLAAHSQILSSSLYKNLHNKTLE